MSSSHKPHGNAEIAVVLIVWALAGAYLFTLSGVLGVHAGTSVTQRLDVLFSSDLSNRIHNLSGSVTHTEELREHPYSVSHPLFNQIWGSIGGTLARQLGSGDLEASIVAARAVVAIVAGMGIGLLTALMCRYVRGWIARISLLLIHLLSTSNILIALPEHMGISSGLLSGAFFVVASVQLPLRRTWLFVLAFLVGATTITNIAFPLACLAWLHLRGVRWADVKKPIGGIAVGFLVVVGLGALLVGPGKLDSFRNHDTIVHKFLNVRFLSSPAAAWIVPAGFTYPVLGPNANVVGPAGMQRLSYEPVNFSGYSAVGLAGLFAWSALLFLCSYGAIRDRSTRPLALFALGWVFFNVAFHSVWGDEFFLYSPHWAWALISVAGLGVANVSARLVVALGALTIAAQLGTLQSVVRAVGAL